MATSLVDMKLFPKANKEMITGVSIKLSIHYDRLIPSVPSPHIIGAVFKLLHYIDGVC